MEGCYFDEPVDFSDAQAISICFEGSQLKSLICYGLRVEGDLCCSAVSGGHLDLFGAHIGGCFWLNGAQLRGANGGDALSAPDMTVDGGMYCGGFRCEGRVNLYGVSIGSTLEFGRASINNPSGVALRAPGLTVKFDLQCGEACTTGSVDLFGAHIGGQLWLNGAHLTQGDSDRGALNAPLLEVGGGMYCNDGFRADGVVNLFGATIGSTLECDKATLNNPDGVALRAPGLSVKADLTCTGGFAAAGRIDLSDARIGGRLELGSPAFTNATADLRGASIRMLRGEPACWPEHLHLNELCYTALEPYLPAKEWLEWLRRDPDGYKPQPYEELATYYHRLGHDEQARTVCLCKERRRRERLHLPAKAWGYLQDAAVGYGYRPARALVWLVLLVALTAAYFTGHPPHAINGTKSPHFQAVIYAMDVAIPILDFGQQRAYASAGIGQWIAWTATVAGWILATTVVAGITRVLSRN